ncbi:MAG: restriction endonuclease subunit S, partial [Kiritimatiellae bacterium]|nr:restriction endonuclease subunit S [Kiritimatiellia bacterium]
MESWYGHPVGGNAGKTSGPPLTFPRARAVKRFKIGELFEVRTPPKRFNANAVTFGGNHPYVVRTSLNNGRRGCILADTRFLSEGKTISFGQDTATIFYQDEPYFTGDKIKVLKFKPCELDFRMAVFLIAVMRKAFANFTWGASSFNERILKDVSIELPVDTSTAKTPDFEWMRERIRALHEYLLASGFENTTRTAEEREALKACPAAPTKEFKIGALYRKVELPKKKFDKRRDTSAVPSAEFSVPLANAKHGDNGIMLYGRPEVFDSEEMTIDIVQNGAVATGDVYPQPQRTGVLWDAYLIKAISHADTERTLCFVACAIEKTIKRRFSYEKKATWERVKGEKIILPVTETGSPDWGLMDTYIRAVMKEAIDGVVAWKDRELEVTRQLVEEGTAERAAIEIVDQPPKGGAFR